mmetsp:Transcript_35959/g.119062  ORF Transcript_35959/g.119062 Transcript_35959/m.119062 type:complete len:88 (-) Transcript_35959:811-1074(-)
MAAVAANPQQQVVQKPTAALMVLYFKKHLQRHMTVAGIAGTEHMSLSTACLSHHTHLSRAAVARSLGQSRVLSLGQSRVLSESRRTA